MAKSELNDWGQPEFKRSNLGQLVRGKYAKLSEADQEKVESEYHSMKPHDFDEAMSRAKTVRPNARSKSRHKRRATEEKRTA